MTLYDSVDFVVSFTGGSGYFITERSTSPFDRTLSLVDGVVINSHTLVDYVGQVDDPTVIDGGEELIILTHPDFQEAANRLAEWKNEKGIITKVYTVSDGDGEGPDTAEDIDEFIEFICLAKMFSPSYVLLMGGIDFIPSFSVKYHSEYGNEIISDYPYSAIGGEFFTDEDDFSFPDLALGRIPVETLDEALVVVDKIINYESFPPTLTSFYKNVTVTGAFQCCRPNVDENGWAERTFIQALEFSRDAMLDEGYRVERIYTTIYCDADTPAYYYDGTSLPDELLAENGYAWAGDTQDIIDAFTSAQGRFLIIHRDHGGSSGWEHPPFNTTNIADDLGNQDPELLPVVFSINCSTGAFQGETRCLADALLSKEGGGAVGVFAATDLSPSYFNSELAKGLVDAVWPDAIGNYGGDTGLHRLGDILNRGKLYMFSQVGSIAEMVNGTEQGQSQRSRKDFLLFHCFGDPTLEIWTAPPDDMPVGITMENTADGVRVDYALDGVEVTIYQETENGVVALGRGTIENGQAEISYIQDFDGNYPIEVSVSKPGYVAGVMTPAAKTVTASAGTGGSISPSGAVSVDYGSDQAFTISANTGYTVEDVLVDGASQGAVSTYTFENVNGGHTISASFLPFTYTITATAGENGGINPSGSTTVSYGQGQVYTFTADTGYEVDTVTVDGQATAISGNSYTFSNVTTNHTIDVTFKVLVVETAWSKTYGYANWFHEDAYGLDVTDDGGYIFVADSNYNTTGPSNAWENFWIVRLDAEGTIIWEKHIGGDSIDHPKVVRQTSDGGFIVAGESYSYRTGTNYCDVWVIKLSSSGGIEWQHSYGGTDYDLAYDLEETFDGSGISTGFLLCGYTKSFGTGGRDVWLVKLSALGTVEKQIALGGSGDDLGRAVSLTPDGGCIVTADTQSFGAGGRDIWVVKLDSAWNVDWQKTFGGSGDEFPVSVVCADGGGYVVGAQTDSFNTEGKDNFWALKLDSSGTLLWQYTYGGTGTDTAQDLEKTDDGGYVMTGWTLSFDGSSYNAWVVKLDGSGLIQWQKSYDVLHDTGTGLYSCDEWVYNVLQAPYGGYVAAGYTYNDYQEIRDFDVWVFKVGSTGALGCGMDTDTSAIEDDTADVIVSDTAGSSETTSAVVNATDCSVDSVNPDVSTQCEIPGTP